MSDGPTRAAWPTLSIGLLARHLQDGQRRSVIEIADCALWPGICYALVGESGIGKTTCLEILALAQRPERVERFVLRDQDGASTDLAALLARDEAGALSAIRAHHFGYVTQTSLLLPFLTVRENVELAQKIAGRMDAPHVDRLLQAMDLAPLARAMPGALSGGQRQRACIARALAHRPSVILADEPTSAVDAEMAQTILRIIVAQAEETGAAALVITHNRGLARAFGLPELSVHSTSTSEGLHTVVSSPPGQSTASALAAEMTL